MRRREPAPACIVCGDNDHAFADCPKRTRVCLPCGATNCLWLEHRCICGALDAWPLLDAYPPAEHERIRRLGIDPSTGRAVR